MAPLNVGLVGFGYWGPNLARNFHSNETTKLIAICDLLESRRNAAASAFPDAVIVESVEALLALPNIEAIALATPTATHFSLTKAVLESGRHAFVEKPLTDNSAEADALVALAARQGLTLHVDHTFLFSAPVEFIHGAVRRGDLGTLLYFDSSRVNLGLFQPDVNVLWDLAVHDLSILQYVTQRTPRAVSATGVFHPSASQASAAFITLTYDDHFTAHIDVSWMSPVKLRRTLISGMDRMLVYDDLERVDKVRMYDAGIEFPSAADKVRDLLISYRVGEMTSPRLVEVEALAQEVSHFVHCVRSGEISRSDGSLAADLIRILEAADESLSMGGMPIVLPDRWSAM